MPIFKYENVTIYLEKMGPIDLPEREFLDDNEQKRLDSFQNKDAQKAYLLSRFYLKKILANHVLCPVQEISFKRTSKGKPFLDGIHFNMSHSGDYLLVGVSETHKVGVDIQKKRPISNLESLVNRFFSAKERSYLTTLKEDDQLDRFFDVWSAKEAFVKCIGEGVSFGLDLFDVDISGSVPTLLACRKEGWTIDNCHYVSLDMPSLYSAAVCLYSGA